MANPSVTLAHGLRSIGVGATNDGIGYGTGAGGTVAQLTNKATGVTLNTASGRITTSTAALAGSTVVSFLMTNSMIQDGDLLALNHVSGGTLGVYGLNARCTTGGANIDIRNNTTGSLSEALVLGFGLIKGALA